MNVHAAAAWFTVSVCPATVSIPERGVGSGFAATAYPSHEPPVPVFPFGIVIHGTSLEADQPHVDVVETNALLVVPFALTEVVVGDKE